MSQTINFVKSNKSFISELARETFQKAPPVDNYEFDCATKTNFVQDKTIKSFMTDFERFMFKKPILIKITPLLPHLMCYTNTRDLLKKMNNENYQYCLGYNMTACGCGKHYCLESHAVIYDKKEDNYIDLTRDFALEKEKYFIPILYDNWENGYEKTFILQTSLKINIYYSFAKSHSCQKITYVNDIETNFTFKEFQKRLQFIIDY